MAKEIKYANSCCKKYDNLDGHYCRKCGSNVQYIHKARTRIAQIYSTDEKYCDQCGKERHDGKGTCSPIKKLIQ
jgi:hypothetical protein